MNFVEALVLIAWGALWLTPALALGISIGLRSWSDTQEQKHAVSRALRDR